MKVKKLISQRFRDALKEARLARGVGQKTLGHEIGGVSQEEISHIESGYTQYSGAQVEKVAEYLKLSMDDFEEVPVQKGVNRRKMNRKKTKYISNRLRKDIISAREEQELTIKALSKQCGVSMAVVSQLESGRSKRVTAKVIQVCKTLGIDINDYSSSKSGGKTATPTRRKRKYRTIKVERCKPLAKNADPNDILNSLIKAKVIEELEGLVERLKNNP